MANDISVYIHWPFCKSKCPYCDFNSHVGLANIDLLEFENAYLRQLKHFSSLMHGKNIKSIFFGGGTPSLARPQFISSIISQIAKYGNLGAKTEITLEANPTSFEVKKFNEFKKSGINRISLGAQSFDDSELEFLGRNHSANDAMHAIKYLSENFDNYSFDMMYALPGQTIDSWKKQLQYAMEFAKYHISLYQLTIERGTKFFDQHRKGGFIMPDADRSADFYEITQEIVDLNNMGAYEVSNYARPKYECVHNLVYWNYGDYLGIGPGAHGRYKCGNDKIYTIAKYMPLKWVEAVNKDGHGLQQSDKISRPQIYNERMMMGLRLLSGIDKTLVVNDNKLQDMLDEKLLEKQNNFVRATTKGRMLLDGVTKYLAV